MGGFFFFSFFSCFFCQPVNGVVMIWNYGRMDFCFPFLCSMVGLPVYSWNCQWIDFDSNDRVM